MAKTKYLTIAESLQTNSHGEAYPDIMQFPIDKFEFSQTPQEYILSQSDIDRFDVLMSTYYGYAFYSDIVLWASKIKTIHDLSPGDTILLPDKIDIERFYARYSRT